jgi:N-terminal acetyltransferase 2
MRNTTTIMQSCPRAMMRVGMRNGLSNQAMSVRRFTKTTAMPKRQFRNRTTSSNFFSSASFQQQTGQAFLRSKNTPFTLLQHIRTRLFHTSRARRSAQSPNPTPNLGSPPQNENLSLGQRMRKLSREYGWSALGVYLALTALDFPFCYLLVRYLGTDRIGEKILIWWRVFAGHWTSNRSRCIQAIGVN